MHHSQELTSRELLEEAIHSLPPKREAERFEGRGQLGVREKSGWVFASVEREVLEAFDRCQVNGEVSPYKMFIDGSLHMLESRVLCEVEEGLLALSNEAPCSVEGSGRVAQEFVFSSYKEGRLHNSFEERGFLRQDSVLLPCEQIARHTELAYRAEGLSHLRSEQVGGALHSETLQTGEPVEESKVVWEAIFAVEGRKCLPHVGLKDGFVPGLAEYGELEELVCWREEACH